VSGRGYKILVEPTTHTGLVDPRGRPIFEGGLTVEDIQDAVASAIKVGHFEVARDIMRRHGMHVCLQCSEPIPEDNTTGFCIRHTCASCGGPVPQDHEATSAYCTRCGPRVYMNGIINRDVQ
jgi:DNA-directed RNA polymerase subunit RPC12/RpoP